MKKEIFVAIVLGGVVGLLLVGGIWTANSALKNRQTALISAQPTGNSGMSEQTGGNSGKAVPLMVVGPLDLALVNSNTVTVEGKTAPLVNLVIQTEGRTYFMLSGSDGTFAKDVDLVPGSNDLTVTALADNGDSGQQTVTVVYSTVTP